MTVQEILKENNIVVKKVPGTSGTNYTHYCLYYKDGNGYPSYEEIMSILFPDFISEPYDRYPTVYAVDWDDIENKNVIECHFELCHYIEPGSFAVLNTPCYYSAWVKGKVGEGVTNYRLYRSKDEMGDYKPILRAEWKPEDAKDIPAYKGKINT